MSKKSNDPAQDKTRVEKSQKMVMNANCILSVTSLAVIIVVKLSNATKETEKLLESATSSSGYSAALHSQCSNSLCAESHYDHLGISCSETGLILPHGYCATFDEDTELLSMGPCRYFELKSGYNMTSDHKVIIPCNLSHLNDYMCGPLNRKGLVCSECADGFGPSVTSFKQKCVNCTDIPWYAVPLFLLLEFTPITVFYLIILIFQIKVVSAPVPCFIMFSQCVVAILDSNGYLEFMCSWDVPLDLKIMLTLYDVFNLKFGHHLNILPSLCFSQSLKFIHIYIIVYVTAFYPILLVFFTWICVELHSRNFKPLVWLWRPFHRCFVRARRGWDTKSDIIDVFTTVFFLSYNRILYQTYHLISMEGVKHIDQLGKYFITYHLQVDTSVSYGSTDLMLLVIWVVIIAVVVILPLLLLTLYPIKAFRSCLSKCQLNFIAVQIFTDKVYSCYKDGLDGGRDLRSFSGLYFFLGYVSLLFILLTYALTPYLYIGQWLALGILLFFVALSIALARPYRHSYMNYWDITILFHFATLLCVLSQYGLQKLLLAKILISIPIIVFILMIILSKCKEYTRKKCHAYCRFRRYTGTAVEWNQSSVEDVPTAANPLIQPTFPVLIYGTTESNRPT